MAVNSYYKGVPDEQEGAQNWSDSPTSDIITPQDGH